VPSFFAGLIPPARCLRSQLCRCCVGPSPTPMN